jgi:hypothetical protein
MYPGRPAAETPIAKLAGRSHSGLDLCGLVLLKASPLAPSGQAGFDPGAGRRDRKAIGNSPSYPARRCGDGSRHADGARRNGQLCPGRGREDPLLTPGGCRNQRAPAVPVVRLHRYKHSPAKAAAHRTHIHKAPDILAPNGPNRPWSPKLRATRKWEADTGN